ncbi:MAG: DUF4272 domain-containing protein [Chloroflexota bacterium]
MSQLRNQDARIVAYRTLSLGALLKRTELEITLQNVDDWQLSDSERDDIVETQFDLNHQLHHWLHNENITPHLSETEQYLLEKRLGTWSERTLSTVGWRTEALGSMLWALNRLDEIPAYDTQFDPADLLAPLDILNPTIDFIWLANLHPDITLSQARDQAESWNWRSRARELKQMGVRPPEGVTFNQIIRFTAERAYSNGYIPEPIAGDFPVLGKSYALLTIDEYSILSAIAYERYTAFSWLCEITSEWESIRID